MPRLAALLTVHNRCRLTLDCLGSLFSQELPGGFELEAYLVDDGSTDGTSEEIRRTYARVHLLHGDGSLYWCGGMRRAWEEASRVGFDYYLWLNDDTRLVAGAIHVLLATAAQLYQRHGRAAIVAGATRDEQTGEPTFGGKWMKDDSLIEPRDEPLPCDAINGNIALIPQQVFELVGNLSQDFTHAIGDHDYSLRAAAQGVPVYLAPGYLGFCSPTAGSSWTLREVSLRRRWQVLHSPKGLPPQEYSEFLRRHMPRKRLWKLLKLYARVVFPSVWVGKQKGQVP